MVIGCIIRSLGYYLILKERVGLGLQHTTFRGYFICEDREQDNNLKAVLIGLIPLTRYCHWRMSVTKERVVCYVFITQLRFDSNPQKCKI